MNLAVVADEVTAAGWRLIGARAYIPDADNFGRCLQAALSGADTVLITARAAAKVPSAQMNAARRAHKPLLLVIADITNTLAPADLEQDVLRTMGVSP